MDQLKKANDTMRASIQHKDELEKKNKKLSDKNAELNLECDSGLIGNKVRCNQEPETLSTRWLQYAIRNMWRSSEE